MISTRTHGVLDYLSSAGMLALSKRPGWRGGARQVLTANASGVLLYSMLTRYQLGLLHLVPMSLHLTLDAAGGAVLCVAGLQADNGTVVRAGLISLGLFEIAVAFLTDLEVPVEIQEGL
jgi:hypothetical protein